MIFRRQGDVVTWYDETSLAFHLVEEDVEEVMMRMLDRELMELMIRFMFNRGYMSDN
ncbi:MAG: hypothetical protein UY96_C0037G0003 [Parcubacteria group bacterium GW2011_GWB1_56_8]|nr:MAG: hypothetical protein UY96_C0037G0003 [Parcubacteria group bacterium GW2011_GWB1_56_8]